MKNAPILRIAILAVLMGPALTAQITTQKVSSRPNWSLRMGPMEVLPTGQLWLNPTAIFPNPVNPALSLRNPIMARYDARLRRQKWSSPLQGQDSLPARFTDFTRLDNGALLYHFYADNQNWTNGGSNPYNWSGYSYALLDSNLQILARAYDTAGTQLELRDAEVTEGGHVLGLVGPVGDTMPSLRYWNPITGQVVWSRSQWPGTAAFSLQRYTLHQVSTVGDSLRVIFDQGWVFAPSYMLTVHRSSGQPGRLVALPAQLSSITYLPAQKRYGLAYWDSTNAQLRYEVRDSTWQLINSQLIALSSLMPGLKMATRPRVLTGQQGIGFIARTRGGSRIPVIIYALMPRDSYCSRSGFRAYQPIPVTT